jgi:hypothetical protein
LFGWGAWFYSQQFIITLLPEMDIASKCIYYVFTKQNELLINEMYEEG